MSGHGQPIPMTSRKGAALQGEAHVPGDKSISHRSLILGALSVGETVVSGLLEARTCSTPPRRCAPSVPR